MTLTSQKNVVFVSVGTSLLTNFKFNYKALSDRLTDDAMNQDILAILDNKLSIGESDRQNPIEMLIDYLCQNFCVGVQRNSQGFVVSDDPAFLNRSASAEIQSVTTFFDEKGWKEDPQEELGIPETMKSTKGGGLAPGVTNVELQPVVQLK